MTIDDKISKLKSEIEIAEHALKNKITDFNFAQIIQNVGGSLVGESKDKLNLNSISSKLSGNFFDEYRHIFRMIRRIIKILK